MLLLYLLNAEIKMPAETDPGLTSPPATTDPALQAETVVMFDPERGVDAVASGVQTPPVTESTPIRLASFEDPEVEAILNSTEPGSPTPEHAEPESTTPNRLVGTMGDKRLIGTLGTVGISKEVEATAETKTPSRMEKIFAPVKPQGAKEADYDFLISDDYDPSKVDVEDAAVRLEGREKIDDYTRNAAKHTLDSLLNRDGFIKDVIGEFAARDQINPKDTLGLVDYIRENVDVRMELGRAFLRRIEVLAEDGQLGDRITKKQKVSDYPGYPRDITMSSQEYSALLALSLIDGTFDNRNETNDTTYDQNGKIIRGQHRDAAFKALFG